MRRLLFSLACAAACASLGACDATIPEGVLACDDDTECPSGWVCGTNARCYSSRELAQQAGSSDGGTGGPDAGAGGDASTGPDAATDAATGTDAAADAAASADAGMDAAAGTDAGADAATDGAAGADAAADAGSDAGATGPTLAVGVTTVARHLCDAISYCENKLGTVATELLATIACHPRAETDDWLQALATAVQDGRITYLPGQAALCLEGLPALDCRRGGAPLPSACIRAFQGNVQTGERCQLHEECADDHSCFGKDDPCGGACRPKGGAGAQCFDSRDCDANDVCFLGTCRPRRNTGGTCIADLQCPLTDRCGPNGACEALVREGAACSTGSDCEGDLVCASSGAASELACAPGANEGASCGPLSACRVGTRCVTDDTGANTCLRIARSGDNCRGGDCPYGLYCDLDMGTCQPRPVAGEACTATCSIGDPNQECATCIEGVCQNGTCGLLDTGFCREVLGFPFETCRGYCTDNGNCADPLSAGSVCTEDKQCQDGLLCVGNVPNATCMQVACQ